MTSIDETVLRRLITIADLRRGRYISIALPHVPNNPDELAAQRDTIERQFTLLHEASIASTIAYAELLNYLMVQLDMKWSIEG